MAFLKKNKNWLTLLAIILGGLFIIFLRKPEAIIHPQFWGEDGRFWYGDAYNHGPLLTLFYPYVGSLQLGMRFFGSLSTILPLQFVPLFFLVAATTFQLLPVVLLNTKRWKQLVPHTGYRLLITIFYLLIPNSFEIHINLTNLNWHLALVAFMVVVAQKSNSKLWLVFDYFILILAGLTGPFAFVLAPIAFIQYKVSTTKKVFKKTELHYAVVLAICAVVQLLFLIFASNDVRQHLPLGINILVLLKMIGFRIAGGAILGTSGAVDFLIPASKINILLSLYLIALTTWVLWKAEWQMRLYIFFSWGIFAGALLKPLASSTMAQWPAMLLGAGNRYFFLPMLCFFICNVWLLSHAKQLPWRIMAGLIIVLAFIVGVPRDFRYDNTWQPLPFGKYTQEFQATPPHTIYCFPVNPGGPDWQTCLNKHSNHFLDY